MTDINHSQPQSTPQNTSKPIGNVSQHHLHLFDDPTEPYLPPPLVFFGTFSAYFASILLALIISLFAFIVIQHGDIELALTYVAIFLLQVVTVVSIEMRSEHLLKILYPVQLFFWTFAFGYFSYALAAWKGAQQTAYPPIYGYWIVSVLGIYQAWLVRGMSKYIEMLNRDSVQLTGYHGI